MQEQIKTVYVNIDELIKADYNPRKWDEKALKDLETSIERFGIVDPAIVNSAPDRMNIVIGGHMRIEAAKALGIAEMPVVYINIPDIEKEKELNIRLNKNQGEFDFKLLANFAEDFLTDVGFNSEDLDAIFDWDDDNPEVFDLKKELAKLDIKKIMIQKGDVWQLGENRLMCGDSTVNDDILKLMNNEKADLCFTDPPYILNYLQGKKKHGKATEGFGYKRDRKYLETDVIPDNFTELWMKNISEVAKDNFHIIVYENWKNLRVIWSEIEKYWKVKNMIVWHLPNRHQGFSSKYRFFSKHDIAMVGSSYQEEVMNTNPEEELLQNEYQTALYAISGKPHWEGYKKGKKIQPTDFIEYRSSDEKSSGQGVVFGTKPTEILIPYIKVLTQKGELVVEPFGGSGSTLIACQRMKRRCYLMEKSPTYAEVIKKRWENLTKLQATKLQ
ncbi:ParB N-terminal domain-containing protein [Candidatus Dojkabacteria bacterium]|jgi:DNA modification methylase|nr:ParB N-terminal domain-containing protein [Candidatus Dojkabacteria bacterium]